MFKQQNNYTMLCHTHTQMYIFTKNMHIHTHMQGCISSCQCISSIFYTHTPTQSSVVQILQSTHRHRKLHKFDKTLVWIFVWLTIPTYYYYSCCCCCCCCFRACYSIYLLLLFLRFLFVLLLSILYVHTYIAISLYMRVCVFACMV